MTLNSVRPIADVNDRQVKVRKHLLHPPEAWERIIPGLQTDALDALMGHGCPEQVCQRRHLVPTRIPLECQARLLFHHDTHYQPAYLHAIAEAEDKGRWGIANSRPNVRMFVGRHGVFVITEAADANEHYVQTAYRHGRRRGPPLTEPEIFDEAVLSLRDKTSYSGGEAMHDQSWLQKASDELQELLASSTPNARRALVLLARLTDGAAAGGPPIPFAATQREAQWLAATPVEDLTCLDELADALLDGDEPWGEILDCLLRLDDQVGLLRLAGHLELAEQLAERTAAMAELYAEAVEPMADFATMRLETLTSSAPQRAIWEVVQLSTVHNLISALPTVTPERQPGIAVIPEAAYALAASSGNDEEWEVFDGDARVGWITCGAGVQTFEALAKVGVNPTLHIEAVAADGRVGPRESIPMERRGSRWYANLGDQAGPGSILQRLSAGVPGGTLRMVIVDG